MKKILPLTLILACLFVSSSSYAYTSISVSCGTVLSWHEEDNKYTKQSVIGWIRGYVTGRNYELDRTMTGNRPDGESYYYAVVKYCKDNPLHDLQHAGKDIYSTLN